MLLEKDLIIVVDIEKMESTNESCNFSRWFWHTN